MALTKITSTNIGANAVTSTALNLTTLSAGNTVITGTASVSTTLSAGNTTITGFANVTGAGSGTFTPYNDPLVVKGTDYTYLHLKGTNNQAAVIYNRNGTTGWFHGLDNSGNMKLVAMAAMDGTGLGNAKDGTAAMLVDTSGRITTPLQPSMVVGNPSFSTGSITGGTVAFDVTSSYNGTNGRFTAPVTGKYLAGISVYVVGTATCEVGLFKNGSIWAWFFQKNYTGGDYEGFGGSQLVSLTAGDYVTWYNNKGSIRAGGDDHRWIYLVG